MKTPACLTLLGLLLILPSLGVASPDLTAASPDMNHDGLVDRADLALMRRAFFSDDWRADLNGDGAVNFADLALLRAAFDGGAPMAAINGKSLPTISLLPANQSVDEGQPFTLEVWMDFTTDATIGGGFDVSYDPTVFAFTDWAPADLGDPAFRRLPDSDVPGVLAGFAFGEFDGLTGPAPVGTLTFQAIQGANLDITPSDTSLPTVGPFVSAVTFMVIDVEYIPANIDVVGVPQASIDVSPGSLDFPTTQLFEETTLDLLVSNVGELDLSIGLIAAVDTIADPFAIITDECSMTALAPMTNCELIVSFIPTAEGIATDSFDVPSDDPFRPGVIVSVSGEGAPPAQPVIVVQPGSVAFGKVRLGQTETAEISISNPGTADLVLGQVGTLDPPFSIETDGCSSVTLAPSDSCTVTARFTPTERGLASDSLDVPSNDPNDPIVAVDVTGRSQTVGLQLAEAISLTARCRNLTTGEQFDIEGGAISIDCESAGLVVSSGNMVSAASFAAATGGNLRGRATGLENGAVSVRCSNKTTAQEINFTSTYPAFNCASRGLVVQPGDRVAVGVLGTAL